MKKTLICIALMMALLAPAALGETLKMGSSIDFAPYEYYDDATGEIVGIDVEIAQAVADKLGYGLEIQDMQFDSIIAAVVSGKVDFGMSGFTVTEERKQSVDFSTPYTTAVQSIIVPENSAIQTVDDLLNPENAYTIGVQLGTTGDLYITDDIEANALQHTVQRFNKAPDAIVALLAGKVDCVIIDDQVAVAAEASGYGLRLRGIRHLLCQGQRDLSVV